LKKSPQIVFKKEKRMGCPGREEGGFGEFRENGH